MTSQWTCLLFSYAAPDRCVIAILADGSVITGFYCPASVNIRFACEVFSYTWSVKHCLKQKPFKQSYWTDMRHSHITMIVMAQS